MILKELMNMCRHVKATNMTIREFREKYGEYLRNVTAEILPEGKPVTYWEFHDDPPLPETETDAVRLILSQLLEVLESDPEEEYHGEFDDDPVADWVDLDDLVNTGVYTLANQGLPLEKRKYTNARKEDFLFETWEDPVRFHSMKEAERKLFRRFTDDLAAAGDPYALEIRARSTAGGNSVFENDWNQAREDFTKLLEEQEDEQAAHALGDIYYYGLCNHRNPEYEKAFLYYSIGAACGVTESQYMLADMYLFGNYAPQNRSAAASILVRLYDEQKYQFCSGNVSSRFAEVAMRMGLLSVAASDEMKEGDPTVQYAILLAAHGYFLEAEYAIWLRRQEEDREGDYKLQEMIHGVLTESFTTLHLPKDPPKTFRSPAPNYLIGCFQNGFRIQVTLKILKHERCRVSFKVLPDEEGETRAMLLTIPEISCCELVDHFYIHAEDAKLHLMEEYHEFIAVSEDEIRIISDSVEFQQDKETGSEIVTFYQEEKPLMDVLARDYVYRINTERKS